MTVQNQPAKKPSRRGEVCPDCGRGITKHDRDGGNRAVVIRAGERVSLHADCVRPTDQYPR